ncbi:hypothetical protein GWI33_018871 [Rhynchophorus ferrugineus]|uniref:CRAL-TRIO domain-containing protein n=1 Tax=Rhynchophorus ferrugineus TaxID=354439 RepID=A0A834HX00_RHYFE|nr:hypothetical protein GWI33_018871 [Rhynchophorus ferrugineus]
MVNKNDSAADNESKENIQQLSTLWNDDKWLKNLSYNEMHFERFLQSTDFEVFDAFERIKAFYEILFQYPEWMTCETPADKKHIIEKDIRVALPHTDKEGRPIYIVKIGNVDCNKMTIHDVVAVDDIWIESLLISNPNCKNGLCVIIDIANYSWRLIKWMTPHNIKIGLKKLQSIPLKEYRFHVVNQSAMISATIKLIWPLLPDYIKKMVMFHFNNRESLHSHIDPTVLPQEYGGKNSSIDYNKIYEDLFNQNEKIHKNFEFYKNLRKV